MSVKRRKNKPTRETPRAGGARPRDVTAVPPAVVLDYAVPAPAAAGRQLLARQFAVGGLLAAGVLLWVGIGAGRGIGLARWVVVGLAVALALIPPVTRAVFALLEKIRHPSPRSATRAAIIIGLLAAAYFVLTAVGQGRDLFPKTHDDQSYLLQMQMLARGRLWMPQHPLADFFDTFYVLVRPKYASMYFPGAALLYVPTVWLHVPTWLMPAMVAGAVVGLVYRIVTELVDGVAGLLAAVLVVSLSWFRMFAILLTSHEPTLLLGLLLIAGWLRWRREERPRRRNAWLLAMGALAGWAAIMRPVDALCFAVPVGIAMAIDLLRRPVRQWAVAAVMVVLGAAPFLMLQLIANRGITGDWLTTPFRLYLDQSQPGSAFGFHRYDPKLRPTSPLPQKQDYYDLFYVPFIKDHQPDRVLGTWGRQYVPEIIDTTLPARVLLLFVPLGLLGAAIARRGNGPTGLGDRTSGWHGQTRLPVSASGATHGQTSLPTPPKDTGIRAEHPPLGRAAIWVIVGVLPAFVLLYMGYTIFLEHYALLVVPSVVLLVVLGGRALESGWPRARRPLAAAFTVGVLALCITVLPELNPLWPKQTAGGKPFPLADDETFHSVDRVRALRENEQYLAPAVILFHYTRPPDRQMLWISHEPVYNTAAAWPDDAPVIHAHDLGPDRNREIFAYYAQRQPDRTFYRWDLYTGQFTKLGTARELAEGRK